MVNNMLDYDLDNDESIYSSKTILCPDKTQYNIEACTVAGSRDGITSKPNEDAFFVMQADENTIFLCVLDGDSSVRPIPSLKNVSGARFSSHTIKMLLREIVSPTFSVEQIMHLLNDQMRSKVCAFPEADILDASTLPGSSVTMVKLDFNKGLGELVSIGDTLAIFYYKDTSSKLITQDLLTKFDDETFTAIKNIAKKKNISNREARKDASINSQLVRRYKEAINYKDKTGYGILNGQPDAHLYFHKVTFSLDNVSGIFMGTDGVIPLIFDPENSKDQKSLLAMVKKGGLSELILYKQLLEDSDPDYNTYVRYKHSDDATGIYMKLQLIKDRF